MGCLWVPFWHRDDGLFGLAIRKVVLKAKVVIIVISLIFQEAA